MTPAELQQIKLRFGIIGNSSALNQAIQIAAQVATTDLTVLINGESGSGKESFSKIIHQLSHRKHGQFIAINCGAIPEGTIDSELFGHEKGSFTGAIDDRKGYFEVTNGGTIFLDEIAEMPIGTQARLLRVLENGEFIRVGSSKVQKTNVRVITASNVHLKDAVDRGRFREDLYYRLSTVPIFVPALRERGLDIELLFRKFSIDIAEKYRMKAILLTDDAINLLLRYRFPGNIRELKNIAEQISILEADNRTISSTVLAKYLPENQRSQAPSLRFGTEASADSFSERELLYKVLFDMRKDVTDLKKLVMQLLKGETISADLLKENQSLFQNITTEDTPSNTSDGQRYLSQSSHFANELVPGNTEERLVIDEISFQRPNVLDISHEPAEDSLSLEKQEKEMIIRALRKNNNKRKYAANALGISERTLYRKIKQYDIEEDE